MKKTQQHLFDIIEGFYLAQILIFLNSAGYFSQEKKKKHSLPAATLKPLLQVLSNKTPIIKKKRDGSFAIADEYAQYPALGFHIEKLLQAYGHVAPGKNKFRLLTDEKAFAAAYKKVWPFQNWNFLLDMLQSLHVKHLLDLGCGAGALAVQFCKQGESHTAAGIDAGEEMCRTARSFIKKERLPARAGIWCANAQSFKKIIPAEQLQRIDIIVASNLLNEFFAVDGTAVVRFLKQLKKQFPGRYLMVVDYYGILGTARAKDHQLQHNYVHDMLQLFSGQGVPPAHYKQWQVLYKRAGCTLEAVTQGQSQGVNWFVHKVLL